MSQIRLKRNRKQTAQKMALARVRATLTQVRETGVGYDRQRFIWGFLVGLSSLALGLSHPVLAQDETGRDRQPVPREPERGADPWGRFPAIRPALNPFDPLWPDDRRRNLRGTTRLVVQQDADGPPKQHFEIPAGDLSTALMTFSRQTDLQLLYLSEMAKGRQTQGLQGDYTLDEALHTLLAGTGLQFLFSDAKTVTLQPAALQGAIGPEEPTSSRAEKPKPVKVPEIVVKDVVERPRFGDAPPESGGFKADYQSSASKTPMSIKETPQSITVITQDSMKARQVQGDLGKALETAAGVNQFSGTGPFGGMSPFGFSQISIRGIALDGDLDTREDGFVSPTFFAAPDMGIYERLEVVKGPSSALYGRISAGGLVNRIRKKPLPEFHSEYSASIGSFNQYRATGDVTGPLFSTNHLTGSGRLVAIYQDNGSFVDGVKSQRTALAPSLKFDLSDSTRLLVQGLYQRDSFVPNSGFPLQQVGDVFRAPSVRRSQFIGVPNGQENTWQTLTGSIQLDQKLTQNWLASLRLYRTHQDTPIRTENYAYGISAAGDVGLYSSKFTFKTDAWTGDLRVAGKTAVLGKPVQLAFGADHFDTDRARTDASVALGTANIAQGNFAAFPTVEPTTISRSTVGTLKNTGVYGQVHVRPIDRVGVLLGGRHDWADSSYVDRLAGTTSDKTDRAFTMRAGLTFDLTKHATLFTQYAQSFTPNPFSIGRDGKIIDPQQGEIYEGGVKTEWFDRKLGITAAVFRIERKNTPLPDPNNTPGQFFSIGAGRQRSDGVELEVNGQPLPGWNITFGGMWLDAKFLEQSDPFFGSIPAGAAKWQVGLFTSYEQQDGLLKGLGLGAGLYAIDDRGVSTFVPRAKLEGYKRVDLTVFYTDYKPFVIQLHLRNLLDETYVEGADRVGAYAQFGSPRAVLATIRYDFNLR